MQYCHIGMIHSRPKYNALILEELYLLVHRLYELSNFKLHALTPPIHSLTFSTRVFLENFNTHLAVSYIDVFHRITRTKFSFAMYRVRTRMKIKTFIGRNLKA